jgi:diguanylate cyclase (GGDEF)-like protein
MERIERTGGLMAVLFIDLDNFKTVNDSLGHPVGDQLLMAMGDRLLTCLDAKDTAARLGGDEFAVLLEDLEDELQATIVAEQIVAVLREPVLLESRQVAVTASVRSTGNRPQPERSAAQRRSRDVHREEARQRLLPGFSFQHARCRRRTFRGRSPSARRRRAR